MCCVHLLFNPKANKILLPEDKPSNFSKTLKKDQYKVLPVILGVIAGGLGGYAVGKAFG
ncbi:hypothetical protein OESDEN_18240 [Oesophagostomum dentatum]|uniref:Uncharacterized protein n=1 Tax=Oesophagostomum dentatum TaxID=61180 RepID=A0A0B1S9U2_OESDE|nr:hypothetical protein OESDEN_18240 [Oesophagostomum dentatum]